MRFAFVACLLVAVAGAWAEDGEEPDGKPPEGRSLSREEAIRLLNGLGAEHHYDRLRHMRRIERCGRLGIVSLSKFWTGTRTSMWGRRLILDWLDKRGRCEEAISLLKEMVRTEEDEFLLRREVKMILLFAKNLKVGRESAETVRELLEWLSERRPEKWIKEQYAQAFKELVEAVINGLLNSGALSGSYPGQFDGIKALGPIAVKTLILMIKERHDYSRYAAQALLDILDPSCKDDVKAILADRALEKVLNAETKQVLMAVLWRLGDRGPLDEYLSGVLKEYAEKPHDVVVISRLIHLYGRAHRYGEAEKYQKALIKEQPSVRTHYYNLACYQSMQGKTDEALKSLEKAFAKGYTSVSNYEWMMRDRELDGVKKDPRFRKLLEKYFKDVLKEREENGEKDENGGENGRKKESPKEE